MDPLPSLPTGSLPIRQSFVAPGSVQQFGGSGPNSPTASQVIEPVGFSRFDLPASPPPERREPLSMNEQVGRKKSKRVLNNHESNFVSSQQSIGKQRPRLEHGRTCERDLRAHRKVSFVTFHYVKT